MNATRVTYSGMVMLVAGPDKAEVGLLRHHDGDSAERHDHGSIAIPKHFPMIAVRRTQLKGECDLEVVADLYKLIPKQWLPMPDSWVAFQIDDYDLTFSGLDVHQGLTVPIPSCMSGCPSNDWDDLGWLVPFWRMIPDGTLKREWQKSSALALHTKLPNGSVAGREPVDFPTEGVRRFRFASWTQGFSDAFVWNSAVSDRLRLRFTSRSRDKEATIQLAAGAGERIDVHVLNHPDMGYRTSPEPATWHLGVMKEFFATGTFPPDPEPDGTHCQTPPGLRGNKYCGAPMVTL